MPKLPLFYNVKLFLREFFSWQSIFLQVLACLLTYVIVITGSDWNYFIFVHDAGWAAYFASAIGLGMVIPIIGLPSAYLAGKIFKMRHVSIVAWALLQAATLGWIVSAAYKAFTGRVQPPHGVIDILVDQSRNWNFGFFEHGIFWGWPSSHTTVAFAMSFALVTLFPKNRPVQLVAILYAFYIGIGVATKIHWFSEFVAGGIFGAIVGIIVGRSFYKLLKA